MRDVVIVRCCSDRILWPQLRGRLSFLAAAEQAFGGPLDHELRSVLLLAYHKAVKAGVVEVLSDAPHSPDGSPPGAYREVPALSGRSRSAFVQILCEGRGRKPSNAKTP